MLDNNFYSKNIPRWNKIITQYPEFQVQTQECEILFKEGGSDESDFIHVFVGTIYNDRTLYEIHTIYKENTLLTSETTEEVINLLKNTIEENIEKCNKTIKSS